jgi:gluconokinase
MGVSGSGKSTVAAVLAKRLGFTFADADSFHPAANISKMRAGVALTDEDRWPWLQAIAAFIDQTRKRATAGAVVTCSALKRRYRDVLIGDRPDVALVYLKGSPELIAQRMKNRHGHFMPASLLQSQFAAFEEPQPDEKPITVAIDPPPGVIVDDILEQLKWRRPAPTHNESEPR